MSVRQSLLAILSQGPCYGYQLRAEFERRTGSHSPLNVGQIYNTLERLERDGLVARGESDEQGHVFWGITDAGAAVAADWLRTPVTRPRTTRDEVAVKIALAVTLPGVDAAAIIDAQRTASLSARDALRGPLGPEEELTGALLRESMALAVEAELLWLDRVEEQLARHPAHVLPLSTERPKRGRPVRGERTVTP